MTDHDIEQRLKTEVDLPDLEPALHAALLQSTTALIRIRRRRAYAMRFGALGLAFAAGLAVMAVLQPSRGTATPENTLPGTVSAADPSGAGQTYAGFDIAVLEDPEALAFAYDAADGPGRLQLLKAAGDYELNLRGDVRAALEYYRQWVRIADDSARTRYDDSDSWLLASLKHTP